MTPDSPRIRAISAKKTGGGHEKRKENDERGQSNRDGLQR
jgi:hypothetical protein